LANTGMQDFFSPEQDPLLGRGTAVVVACPGISPSGCDAANATATLALPGTRPAAYHVLVAAAVTTSGDPLAAARRELNEASRVPLETLRAEHQAWWRDYWSRS
jgi:hypothetical protein